MCLCVSVLRGAAADWSRLHHITQRKVIASIVHVCVRVCVLVCLLVGVGVCLWLVNVEAC